MRVRSFFLLVVAMVCGIFFATLTSWTFFTPPASKTSVDEAGALCSVFTVNAEVAAGKTVPVENLVVIKVPKEKVPPGGITSFFDISDHKLKANLLPNTILSEGHFSYKTDNEENARTFIPPGFQAVSVQIHNDENEEPQNDFLKVKSGDLVDVLLIKKENGGTRKNNQISAILEGIKVLDTKKELIGFFSMTPQQQYTVSLMLNEVQTQRIMESLEAGKLKLRVRKTPKQDVVPFVEEISFRDVAPAPQGKMTPLPISDRQDVRSDDISSFHPFLAMPNEGYAAQAAPNPIVPVSEPVKNNSATQNPPSLRANSYSTYYGDPNKQTNTWITILP